MPNLPTLAHHLDALLKPTSYADYCPNGLQVEGQRDITVLVTGVTACQALIEKAIELKADAMLVHHGYFWRGESPCIVGMQANRLRLLMTQGMHLFAYHLPLDAHESLGNNAQLAQKLGIVMDGLFDIPSVQAPIGFKGTLSAPVSGEEMADVIAKQLGRTPLYIPGGELAAKRIQTVGWCTGAGQDFIGAAAQAGLDAYITGEVSERTVHQARELGIHFYAAGHHATERYGVKAVGDHLVDAFTDIKHYFVDIPNPV